MDRKRVAEVEYLEFADRRLVNPRDRIDRIARDGLYTFLGQFRCRRL